MNNILISSAPQPSGNVASASPEATNGASNNDQASAPFAQMLARKVDKSSPPAQEAKPGDKTTQSGDKATGNDAASPPPEQTAVPVDALNAIMSQIPVEMRGTNVADRMVQLASGDRAAAVLDPLNTATPASGAPAGLPTAGKGGATFQAELSDQDIPAQQLTDTGKKPAAQTTGNLAASGRQILADAMRQSASVRQEPTIAPVQLAASQINVAAISQAAVAAMAGTPTGNPQASTTQTISTPLASPAWGEDFSQKISWMVTQKNQVAELHLNPPNLGPLDVVLKISDTQATALFTSPHAAVREAVENAMPKLRELLADNGIMLGNATVSDQAPRDRQSAEFSGKGAASSESGSADDTITASETMQTVSVRRHNGLVDTFA